MKVEIRPSAVNTSPNPSEAYVRLDQEKALQIFEKDIEVKSTASSANRQNQGKDVELVVTIDRHSSGWPQW